MIFFVAPKQETWCMEAYLRQEGRELARRMRVLNFESIIASQDLPLGTYIFGAIDQLSPTEHQIAETCWNALSSSCSQITLLNHPRKVLCRYDLLKTCFALKRNTYQVMRASKFYRYQNYPVFIRSERRHEGSLTPLLHTPGQLRRALLKTLLRGHYLRDLIIVEYRDTADPAVHRGQAPHPALPEQPGLDQRRPVRRGAGDGAGGARRGAARSVDLVAAS